MCRDKHSPPPAPRFSRPPPPKEFVNFIDKETGASLESGTNPVTGKKERVFQYAPRSPQKEEAYQKSSKITNDILNEIDWLKNNEPDSIIDVNNYIRFFDTIKNNRNQDLIELTQRPDIDKYINEFKEAEIRILDDNFAKYEAEVMEDLRARGYGNSSFAAETRASLAYQKSKALQELHRDALKYGYDSADREIDRNTNLYNIREAGRVGQIGAEEAKYGLEKENIESQINKHQRSITNRAGLFEMAQSILDKDFKQRMTGAQLVGNQGLSEMQAENNAQYSAYNAEINSQKLQHDMDMNVYNNTPPSFMEKLVDTGITVGGAMMGGPAGAAVASNMTNNKQQRAPMQNQQYFNDGWADNRNNNSSRYFSFFAPPTNKKRVHANDVGEIRR